MPVGAGFIRTVSHSRVVWPGAKRSLLKAILAPPGDQAGLPSLSFRFVTVSFVRALPSGLTVQISVKSPLVCAVRSKTIFPLVPGKLAWAPDASAKAARQATKSAILRGAA